MNEVSRQKYLSSHRLDAAAPWRVSSITTTIDDPGSPNSSELLPPHDGFIRHSIKRHGSYESHNMNTNNSQFWGFEERSTSTPHQFSISPVSHDQSATSNILSTWPAIKKNMPIEENVQIPRKDNYFSVTPTLKAPIAGDFHKIGDLDSPRVKTFFNCPTQVESINMAFSPTVSNFHATPYKRQSLFEQSYNGPQNNQFTHSFYVANENRKAMFSLNEHPQNADVFSKHDLETNCNPEIYQSQPQQPFNISNQSNASFSKESQMDNGYQSIKHNAPSTVAGQLASPHMISVPGTQNGLQSHFSNGSIPSSNGQEQRALSDYISFTNSGSNINYDQSMKETNNSIHYFQMHDQCKPAKDAIFTVTPPTPLTPPPHESRKQNSISEYSQSYVPLRSADYQPRSSGLYDGTIGRELANSPSNVLRESHHAPLNRVFPNNSRSGYAVSQGNSIPSPLNGSFSSTNPGYHPLPTPAASFGPGYQSGSQGQTFSRNSNGQHRTELGPNNLGFHSQGPEPSTRIGCRPPALSLSPTTTVGMCSYDFGRPQILSPASAPPMSSNIPSYGYGGSNGYGPSYVSGSNASCLPPLSPNNSAGLPGTVGYWISPTPNNLAVHPDFKMLHSPILSPPGRHNLNGGRKIHISQPSQNHWALELDFGSGAKPQNYEHYNSTSVSGLYDNVNIGGKLSLPGSGKGRKKKAISIPSHVPNMGPLSEYATAEFTADRSAVIFTCKTCTKSFNRVYNLKSHLRTHSNEKPFACAACQKCFLRKADMIRHTKIHSRTQFGPKQTRWYKDHKQQGRDIC